MPDIAYSDKGKGQPIVFLHGFCESKEMWDEFSLPFTKSLRVCCPDLPGFGRSPLPQDKITVSEVANTIVEWMRQKTIDHPILVGHSLGGYVAMEIVKRLGDNVKGLCLFHSTAYPDDTQKKKTRDKTIKFLRKHGTAAFIESFLPQLFAEGKRESLEQTIEKMVSQAREIPVEVLIAYTAAMRDRTDSTEALSAFSGRSAMICGALDTAVPLENSRKHRAWVTKYLELEGTAHMGMYEDRERCYLFLQSFVTG